MEQTKKVKSSVQDFADTIKDKPKKIIAWAKREIKEYEKLIKILDMKDELQVKLKQSLVCSNCGATNIPRDLRIENLALRAELNLRRKSE